MTTRRALDPGAWRRLAPTRLLPDDNPFSVRLRKYLTGTHLLLAARPADTGPTPARQVWRRGPVRLWRYTADAGRRGVPVLVVYAMILRPYILDLVPGRSVIACLLEAGHDVWLIDWGTPSPADSGIDLDTYVQDHLHAAVTTMRATTGADAFSLLGHCQGGTLTAIYAALHPAEVRNLVLLAAPIDFAPLPPHPVGSWSLSSRRRWYDPWVLAGPGGNVPVHLPGRVLAALSAPAAVLPWVVTLRERMATNEEGRAWLAACQWVDDGPPIARAAFVQWLADCYQRNALVSGDLSIGARAVRLDAVDAAVLSVSGRRDVVTPPHQVARRAHFPAAGSFSAIAVAAGHVGLIVGPTARAEVHEPMARWLAARSGRPG